MKREMSRPITERHRNSRGIIRSQNSRALIELPDEDAIQSQIRMQNEGPRGISLNHVRVRSFVSAKGEASRRRIRGLFRPSRSAIVLDVRRGPEPALRSNRQYRYRAAKIVGDQHKLPRRMNAQIRRPSSAGTDGVEQSQLSVSWVDRERADCPFVAFADAVGLIRRIQPGGGSVHGQAVRADPRFINTAWPQRSGRAIHLKHVNASTISRRQIDLRRQHIVQWRTERAHVSHERRLASSRLRPRYTREEWGSASEESGRFQEGTTGNLR